MAKKNPTADDQAFSTRIKQIRAAFVGNARGCQSEMAEEFGLTRSTWNNYETARARPKPDVRRALMERGVNMQYLDFGIGDMFLTEDGKPKPAPMPEALRKRA